MEIQPLFHLMTNCLVEKESRMWHPDLSQPPSTTASSLSPNQWGLAGAQIPLTLGPEALRKSFLKSDRRTSCYSLSSPLAPSPVSPLP